MRFLSAGGMDTYKGHGVIKQIAFRYVYDRSRLRGCAYFLSPSPCLFLSVCTPKTPLLLCLPASYTLARDVAKTAGSRWDVCSLCLATSPAADFPFLAGQGLRREPLALGLFRRIQLSLDLGKRHVPEGPTTSRGPTAHAEHRVRKARGGRTKGMGQAQWLAAGGRAGEVLRLAVRSVRVLMGVRVFALSSERAAGMICFDEGAVSLFGLSRPN